MIFIWIFVLFFIGQSILGDNSDIDGKFFKPLEDYSHFDSKYIPLKRLQNCGFTPQVIVDVGCGSGDFAKFLNFKLWDRKYLLIDGDEDNEDNIKSKGFDYEIAVVGDKKRVVTYYKVRINTPEEYAVEYNMTTLHSILSKRNLSVDFLKLDIDGSEYEAILGLRSYIRTIQVIMIKMSIMSFNVHTISFAKFCAFLDNHGFALFDFIDIERDSLGQVLTRMETIWIRKTSPLWYENCTQLPKPNYLAEKSMSHPFKHIHTKFL